MKGANRHRGGPKRAAVLTAVLSFLLAVTEGFVLPFFFYGLERAWPLPMLMTAVAAVTLLIVLLHTALSYCREVLAERRDHYRTVGYMQLARLALTASYEQATDPVYCARIQRMRDAWGRHIHAPLPQLWDTLSALLCYSGIAAAMLAVLLCTDMAVTLVTVVTAVLSAVVHRAVTRRNERLTAEEADGDGTLSNVYRAATSSDYAKEIRVLGSSTWLRSVSEAAGNALAALFKRRSRACFVYNAVDTALFFLRNAAGAFVILPLFLEGVMPFSYALVCVIAIGLLSESIGKTAENAASLHKAYAELCVWRELLKDTRREQNSDKVPTSCEAPHTLDLCAVSYEPHIVSVSLSVSSGELVGVFTDSNEAATTMAKLCCGLLSPTDGTLLFDGADVSALCRRIYYGQVAPVFRDSTVADVTIAECVCADCAVDDERLRDCLDAVRLTETVARLPRGVDTPIGRGAFDSGVELSKGQLQRLLLARAIYRQAPVCVLDDPLTALDPLAEQAVLRSLRQHLSKSCVLLLSNRPSVLRRCDRLAVVRDGAIVEEGTHDDLLRRDGYYASQVRWQSGVYREGRDPDGDC